MRIEESNTLNRFKFGRKRWHVNIMQVPCTFERCLADNTSFRCNRHGKFGRKVRFEGTISP